MRQRTDKLLKVSEVADLLNVSTRSVYRMIETGVLPYVDLPCGIRFDAADFAAWCDQRKRNAIHGGLAEEA